MWDPNLLSGLRRRGLLLSESLKLIKVNDVFNSAKVRHDHMFPEISAAWILKIATVEAEIAQTEGACIGLVFNDVAEKLN